MSTTVDVLVRPSVRGPGRTTSNRSSSARADLRSGRGTLGRGRRRAGAPSCLGLGPVPQYRVSARNPLRLTRRGQVIVSLAGMIAGCVLGLTAWMSAPQAPPAAPVPSAVVVRAGETLWSIAGRLAPGSDPRQEVATLVRINGLTDGSVFPGQTLRTR